MPDIKFFGQMPPPDQDGVNKKEISKSVQVTNTHTNIVRYRDNKISCSVPLKA